MVSVKIERGCAVVTLNRPEKRNAISTELILSLEQSLEVVANNQQVRVVVLMAEGTAFCAGSDLKELGPLDGEGMKEHEAVTARVVRRLTNYPLPTIVAVEGYALGGGFALAIACDYVVSSSSAKWEMPEVKNGWIPPWGLTPLVTRVGKPRALNILLSIEALKVDQLKMWGLVDAVTAEGGAGTLALKLANYIAELPIEGVRSVKGFLNGDYQQDDEADLFCLNEFKKNCESENSQNTFRRFRK